MAAEGTTRDQSPVGDGDDEEPDGEPDEGPVDPPDA